MKVFCDRAKLYHLVSHVDHRLAPVAVGDSEHFSRGRVIEFRPDFVGIDFGQGLADRPTEGSVLFNDRLGKLNEGR